MTRVGDWDATRRRLALGTGAALTTLIVLAALAVYVLAPGALTPFAFVAAPILAATLLAEGYVIVAGHAPAPPTHAHDEEGPPVLDVILLTVRCSECGTVFDIMETGQRPLHHVCPGCGAEGELSPPQTRQVRLRCGACGSVDAVEDVGKRPLHHRCLACGRLGIVR